MRHRRLLLAIFTSLAMLLPAVATAQGNPFGNTFTLLASLNGMNEVPPGDPDGFGFARVNINLDTEELCYRLSVANIDPATASHIHIGGAGAAGPVVVPLTAPTDGFAKGCVSVDGQLLADILNNPGGYYVNVHNAAYPPGAVRGQLALFGAPVEVVTPEEPVLVGEVLAEGLSNPRGIAVADDGSVYVATAGVGGDDCVTLGEGENAAEFCSGTTGEILHIVDGNAMPMLTGLPSFSAFGDSVGPQDVIVAGDTIYALVGWGFELPIAQRDAWGEDAVAFGTIVASTGGGDWEIVADLLAYETANNSDGDVVDSNPFSFVMVDDGFVVSDAGANALLHVSMDGTISTIAVFPIIEVEAPPFLGLPPGAMIPMHPVPTSVITGPDGAYYVAQLTGFPFPPGGASVWRIKDENADGDAADEGEFEVFATGFTNIIGVAFDNAGNLYVLEMVVGGLLNANPEDPATLVSALTRVSPDGTQTDIPVEGLIFATGLSIGADDALYVSNMGVMPGMGEVVKLTWQ